MAGWMSALLRSSRAVCSDELSLLSSMSVGGGGGGGGVVVRRRRCQLTESKRTKEWERYPNRV